MPTVGGMIVTMPTPAQAVSSVFRGIQWGLDRMVSVGYGVVYDYIVARFRPYQELHGEVLRLVEGAVAPGTNRREIRVLDVVDNGTKLANGRVFINTGAGIPDGFRCDTEGNLWCGFGGGEGQDGVAIFNPDAKLIGRILLPERCANLCFGGPKRNRLFLASSQSLYSVYVNAQGATLS